MTLLEYTETAISYARKARLIELVRIPLAAGLFARLADQTVHTVD
jgi:hypothetical protein